MIFAKTPALAGFRFYNSLREQADRIKFGLFPN